MPAGPLEPAEPTATPRRPLCVVSPHLDDAVLSCGRLLAAMPGSVVLTAFGGAPPGPGSLAHEWDLGTTGHEAAEAAVAVRRAEDEAATALLDATPYWTAWSQYHEPPPTVVELATAIAESLAAMAEHTPHSIAVPLGIMHPDHVAVSDAVLRYITERIAGDVSYYVYAEVPYLTAHPGLAEDRLDRWRRAVALDAVDLPQAPAERRVTAVDAYATQMPMLRALLPHIDEDLRGTERYWRVGPATQEEVVTP